MGAMLLTGLACLGAELGHARLVTRSSAQVNDAVRRFTIIALALPEGLAVIGVVVGLLAVFAGKVQDPTTSLLAAGPAVLGGLIALAVILRDRSEHDSRLVAIGAAYVVGLAVLGAVVAALAMLVTDVAPTPVTDWPLVVLGPIVGLAALSIGWLAAGSIGRITAAPLAAANEAVARSFSRLFVAQMIGVAAGATAIALIEVA